jgi:hypothetical protein
MAWIEPIIDRVGANTERYNADDFNRAANNISYIVDLLGTIGFYPLPVAIPQVSRITLPFPTLINALEQALKNIEDSGVQLPTEWELSYPYWTSNPNDRIIDYKDMNRWEKNIALLKLYVDRMVNHQISTTLISGMSYSGNNYRVQIFSRGR